jgi:hypothetical protein
VLFYFRHNVDDLKNFAEPASEDGLTPLQVLSLHFLNVSYSTARGIWFEKMKGTALAQTYPPLVAPMTLLADISYDDTPWAETSEDQ